jgi:hypothetical protein
MPAIARAYVGMTWLLTGFVDGNAKTKLGRAGRRGRHGGEASALSVGTDDVGLDSLVISYQEESTKKKPQP